MTTTLKMSEQELMNATIDLAEALDWRVFHPRPALDRHGRWSTAMSGHTAAGYLDLTLVRDRVVFAELKSDIGRLSIPQQDWCFALSQAGAEVHIWRPVHWRDGTIEKVLRHLVPTGGAEEEEK